MRYLLMWASLLVLPLALFLFLQWPLRDWVQAYSRQVNDLGQIVFAIYIAFAVVAASRTGSHLSAGRHGAPHSGQLGHWRAWLTFACVAPWALFMLVAGYASVKQSVLGLEHFAETLTPGYFVIKLAVLVLVLLVLVDSVLALKARVGQAS